MTPWTAAYQAPPSMGFSRQEYWSGVPSPSPVLPASLRIFYSVPTLEPSQLLLLSPGILFPGVDRGFFLSLPLISCSNVPFSERTFLSTASKIMHLAFLMPSSCCICIHSTHSLISCYLFTCLFPNFLTKM